MKRLIILNGQLIFPDRIDTGKALICKNGKIEQILADKMLEINPDDQIIDAKTTNMYLLVLSIMHVHGGGGHDYTEATEEAFRTATTAHLKHGATGIFPTLSSTSFERIYQAVDVCEHLMKEKDSPILGLHIEGPYLNPRWRVRSMTVF